MREKKRVRWCAVCIFIRHPQPFTLKKHTPNTHTHTHTHTQLVRSFNLHSHSFPHAQVSKAQMVTKALPSLRTPRATAISNLPLPVTPPPPASRIIRYKTSLENTNVPKREQYCCDICVYSYTRIYHCHTSKRYIYHGCNTYFFSSQDPPIFMTPGYGSVCSHSS